MVHFEVRIISLLIRGSPPKGGGRYLGIPPNWVSLIVERDSHFEIYSRE
jgi:hypothetical protein